jgi:8-oxo-dGTP diphosphatase
MNHIRSERSAGGIVIKSPGKAALSRDQAAKAAASRKAKILMVRVRNLKGDIVWTFPKGHIEKKENAITAALREVKEETGWNCRILGAKGSVFQKARYFFKRKNTLVKKEVSWFLMAPLSRTGKRDPLEIMRVGWFSVQRAKSKAAYPSDKKLLEILSRQAR